MNNNNRSLFVTRDTRITQTRTFQNQQYFVPPYTIPIPLSGLLIQYPYSIPVPY